MSHFAYLIRHTERDDPAHAWSLERNDRTLAQFGSLASALGSAKSLHDIDGRGGDVSTVDVLMPYGRFRVEWVDGSSDAISVSNVTDEFEAPRPRTRTAMPAGTRASR